MGLDAKKAGVHILKGLNFSIKTCYRLVRNHPSILGIMLIFYLLYRFLPSVFRFLLHSSPVFICTSVLLATLVASGNRDPPKVEDKLQRRYSRRLRVKKDDHVIEEKEITSVRTLGRKMLDIKEEVETTSGDQRNKGKARGRRVTFSPIHDYGFIGRTIKMDDQPKEILGMNEIFTRDEKPLIHDVSIADDQDVVKEEISKPVDEISDSRSRDCLKEHDENVESSKSVSDHTESSSSSKASIAATNPIIDELPSVPDSQTPQPVLLSINEFDGAPEESNDCSEESEVEQGKYGSKAAVSWTVDDEKNLMDLGCSEVERNKRLESLMARRRARKTMRREADKNHLGDFDCNDAPYQIAPLAIIKNKTFAQPYIENETGGMQPIPGSAPSVLIPRKNPFDLPYGPHEEKPNLTGDSFSQEFMTVFSKDVYCRHESFCFGSASSSGGLKQDKGDTRISAFFIPEDIAPSSGQRQLSDTSDSVSSVPETELQSSIAEQEEEQKQVIEQEGELISNIDHSPHYVEEIIQPPEVDLVENHQEQTRDTDYSKAEINLPNTSEPYINPDVVEEKFSELKSSSSSSSPSSSPSSEMNEKFLHEDNTSVVGSLNIEPTTEGLSMAVKKSNLKNDVAAAVDYSIPSAIEKRTIDESLFCVDKGVVHTSFPSLASFPSIASDMQVEVSEVGSPRLSVERTISLTDGECFQYNESVKSDISSGSEGHWTASSGLCAVDETESKSREVNEISESDVIKAGLLGADDESDEPLVIEPAFEQVRINSNSTSYPTVGQINQIPALSAEPETDAGVRQTDSERVDPIASSSSPAQILVERSTVKLSTSNGLQDSTSFQMLDSTGEHPINQIPASIAEPEISLGVGQLDLKEEVDPMASICSPAQPSPSDGLQHSFQLKEPREEDAMNQIPSSSAGPETNVGVLQLEKSMVEPPYNNAVQHSTSSQVKERTEEDASNHPGSSVKPEMNIELHQLDSEEKLDTVASSALPTKYLLENSIVQPPSNDAVQHSTSSQTMEPTEGGPIRQIPASNDEPEMHVRDELLESEEKVEPVPSSSSPAEHLCENLMVQLPPDDGLQPSTSTHIKEPMEDAVISQIPASSGEPKTSIEVNRLDSEERMDPIATSFSPVQLLVEKSTCQQSLNGDVGEVTQTTSMVQPSSNSDINKVTQVSSEFHPSPSGDLHGERQISSMVQESLSGDVHEVKQVNKMVQPSPNGDIHEEAQVRSIMHPSPDGDLHEETQVSLMVQPSPDGDIHEETHISEMVQPSLNGDLREETHASSMVHPSPNGDIPEETHGSEIVQPSLNGDLHEETHGSEIVQPSLNGDLHEETRSSSMVQPTTNGDHHEVTQVNTMVQPSPNDVNNEETQVSLRMHPSPDGDLHEETHVSEMIQPSLNGDLYEETQASLMVQPSPNGDIHKETHVSEMVQPSHNGDLREETHTSSIVQPTLNGDIQEEIHVTEMVQPSRNCDLHEKTQASLMVQPTINGDRHEVTQVNTVVQPSRNGDIHEETQVSSIMHPSPHGDIHEETQVSSIMHPSPHGDLHEETHVSEMVQPSFKGDLREETQASSMAQPTTNGDHHEVTQEPSIMSTEETDNPVLVAHNMEKPKSSIEDVADISDESSQGDVTMNLPQTKATEGDANNVNKPVIVDDEDKPKPLSIEEISNKSVEHVTTVNSPQKLLSESGVSSDRPTGIQKQDSEADHVDTEIGSNINSSSNSHKDVPPAQEVLEIPMESQEESSPAKSPQQQYLTEHEGLRSLLR